MFEEFKMNTITKNDFVAGLGDKADKEEIANIVILCNITATIQPAILTPLLTKLM